MTHFAATSAPTGERRRHGRTWGREYAAGTAFTESADPRPSGDPILDASGALKFMHQIERELADDSNAFLRPGALWDYIMQARQAA